MRQTLRAVAISALLTSAATAQGPAPVRYQLTYRGDGNAAVEISMALPAPIPRPVDFAMPRAIPMGYGTQPYDRFVTELVALDAAGHRLAVTDIDGPRWRIAASTAQPLARVSYRVDVQRMEAAILNAGDASRIRPGYLGLLGYSVFGFVDALLETPVTLDIAVPETWPVFSTLAPQPGRGRLTVPAPHFLALADAQLLAGPRLELHAAPASVPFTLALYSEQPDLATGDLRDLAASALRATSEYFGTTPLPHYTTAFEVLQPISAQHEYRFSMEHLTSATYRFAVGQVDVTAAGRDRTYYNLLHHTVHSWLPKQCAPIGYYPTIWDYAAPIDGIWFAEGWAQYIAADIFAGDGPDAAQRRQQRATLRFDAAAADTLPPIRGIGTAELSTIAAHQYSDDFRISATVFSRGARMAQAIDERVRSTTQGKRGMRDIARGLMAWCARSGEPVTDRVIEQVVRQQTGVAVRDLIDTWLAPRGTRAPARARPD